MKRRRRSLGLLSLSEGAQRAAVRARRALGDRRATPNVPWISELSGANRRKISAVLEELEDLLPMEEEIRHRHVAAGRASYAQIRAPFDLYALVRLLGPEHVVETGVSSGVSSAHLLAALKRNRRGRLHSIDLPTRQKGPTLGPEESPVSLPPGHATGWAVPDPLRTRWDLRIGPAQKLLPRLVRELPRLGLFLHDDLHTPEHLTFELTTVRPHLAPGAVVLADNTMWTGEAFPRFCHALGVRLVRRGRTDLVGLAAPRGAAQL